jgi:hypothetical protein
MDTRTAPARRAGYFLVFAGLLLAMLFALPASRGFTLVTAGASDPPTIVSDKPDYAPGELVTLTGSNWQPGELVSILVNDDQGQSWSRSSGVTATAGGQIFDQFNLPDWFIASYTVTATGPASGTATTTFTDGNIRAKVRADDTSRPAGSLRLDVYDPQRRDFVFVEQ